MFWVTPGLWLGEEPAERGACGVGADCRAFRKGSGGRVHVNLEPEREVTLEIGTGDPWAAVGVRRVGQKQREGETTGRTGFWGPGASAVLGEREAGSG